MTMIIPPLFSSYSLLLSPAEPSPHTDHFLSEVADVHLILQKAFPRTLQRPVHDREQESADAWPLPGAAAKKSSKPVATTKVKTTGVTRAATRPLEGGTARLRLLQRRVAHRNNHDIPHSELTGSPKKKGDNKDSIMSGRTFSRESGNSKRFLLDSKSTTTAHPRVEIVGDKVSQVDRNSAVLSNHTEVFLHQVIREENVDVSTGDFPLDDIQESEFNAPTCLRFYNSDITQMQVKKLRYNILNVRICVPINTVPLFEYLFTRPLSESNLKSDDMVSYMAVNEISQQEAKGIKFNKFRGLGQLINGTKREQELLGNDRLYSVLTLSIVPNQRLISKKVGGDEILPQNSFKIIRHRGLDGYDRFFVAYFRHQQENSSGINAGFHEIKSQWGQFIIDDKKTGCSFISADLGDFTAGMEKLTGLRFRPDANIQPLLSKNTTVSSTTEHDFTRWNNVFIRKEAAMRTTPPFGEINIDDSLGFFSSVEIDDIVKNKSYPLYRNCFRIEGNTLHYVDERGVTGKLQFSLTRGGTFQRLIWPSSTERSFLLGMGAKTGNTYTMQGVLSLLKNNNMTLLNPPSAVTRIQYSPGFYLESGEPEIDVTENDDVILTGDEHVSAWCGSCFSFNNNQLQFSDHLARQGTLLFSVSGDKLQIAVRNTPAATVFASYYGLKSNQTYTLNELQDRLYARGMVQIPHDRLKM